MLLKLIFILLTFSFSFVLCNYENEKFYFQYGQIVTLYDAEQICIENKLELAEKIDVNDKKMIFNLFKLNNLSASDQFYFDTSFPSPCVSGLAGENVSCSLIVHSSSSCEIMKMDPCKSMTIAICQRKPKEEFNIPKRLLALFLFISVTIVMINSIKYLLCSCAKLMKKQQEFSHRNDIENPSDIKLVLQIKVN